MITFAVMKGKMRIPVAVALAAVLLLAGCGRRSTMPQDGLWYRLTYRGRTSFVMTHADSALVYSDQTPDTVIFRIKGRKLILQTDAGTRRLPLGKITLTPYVEPDFMPSDYLVYREPCSQVSMTSDLKYGSGTGYWTSLQGVEADVMKIFTQGYVKSFRQNLLDLTLDLYRPAGVTEKRPLILFIHGGAFYVGDKQEPAYVDLCRHFASLGYVTASMNYRMGFHVGKDDIERAGYMAAQDAHAAMRWLVSKSDEYGIDPDWLYVAGSSAGSITALNMVFMKDADRPESTRGVRHLIGSDDCDLGPVDKAGNDLRTRFQVRAIANMWGAVSSLSLLGNARTSIISFHGDADQVVPFDRGYPFSMAVQAVAKRLSDVMYGSKSIHSEAVRIGLRSEFHPYPGQGHAFNTSGPDKQPNGIHYDIRDDIVSFFFKERVGEPAALENLGGGRYRVAGDVAAGVQWKADGGFIVSADGTAVTVLWRQGEPHRLQSAGRYTAGPGFLLDTLHE